MQPNAQMGARETEQSSAQAEGSKFIDWKLLSVIQA
jgi:hypothetical protein